MINLKLKVYIIEGDDKNYSFTPELWDETTIIYEKLVRNLKEEFDTIVIKNFDKTNAPFITMDIDPESIDELEEDEITYVADYLCGNETENPVYLNENECKHTCSEIVFDEKNKTFLESFNNLAIDVL